MMILNPLSGQVVRKRISSKVFSLFISPANIWQCNSKVFNPLIVNRMESVSPGVDVLPIVAGRGKRYPD